MMRQWGANLLFLLPTLWLASVACGIYGECSDEPSNLSLFAAGNCKSDVTVDQLIRRSARRNGDQSPIKKFFTVAAIPSCTISALDYGPTSQHASLRLEILHCWQFRWRTALSPRAPSIGL